MLLDTFYTDKRVVVTGGCGFVGSYLVERLSEMGAEVIVLDNMSRGRWVFPDKAHYHRVDAGEYNAIAHYIRGSHAVFNLAASVAGVIYNAKNHIEMFDSNMRLQTAPLMAAAKYGVPNFLQVSSVCVYSPENNHPCVEENGHEGSPHVANDGYAWSKRMGERAALWSGISRPIVVRPSNIYGVRDYFDSKAHVIPALIAKCARANDSVELHGSGEEVREFIFATDVVEGMLWAMAFGEANSVYNIGTHGSTAVSMRKLLSLIMKYMNKEHLEIITTPQAMSGDKARWSNSLALMSLGWKPQVSLQDGLLATVMFYRDCIAQQV